MAERRLDKGYVHNRFASRMTNFPREENMDMDNQVCHDDPQFERILRACLRMEIAAANGKLEANTAKIKSMKEIMRSELDKRKKLKEKMTLMTKIRMTLSETLSGLYVNIREVSDTLEMKRANADDAYKLTQLRSQEYRNILSEIEETCHSYHAMYEEFPLAKVRKTEEIKLAKLQIELMVMTYKKNEAMTIIRQQRRVNWIRTRSKIIEFAAMMTERYRLEEKLMKLKANADHCRRKLQSIEIEVQAYRKREEDQVRLRKQKMLKMAPPKINIPYRQMYAPRQSHTGLRYQWQNESNDDTMSVNTVILEELCINESTMVSPPTKADMESARGDDLENNAEQAKPPVPKDSIVVEETDMRVAPDIEADAERAILPVNDAGTEETRQGETQESQEPGEERASFSRAKENFAKHSAVQDTQDEVRAKRMRLQREDDAGDIDKIAAPRPTAAVENADAKSPSSMPKITKIETVRYDIKSVASAPRPAQCPSSAVSSTFSPSRYDYCDSNVSVFNQDVPSKGCNGAASLQDESLYNYQLSPSSIISPMYVEENAQMTPPTKHTSEQSNNAESSFLLGVFMKKAKKNYTLF